MSSRRSLAALTALCAPLALASPALAATQTSPGTIPSNLTTINLLNINDFHGHIDDNGVALVCLVEQRRAALGANSTGLFAAGDLIGASPFVSASAQDIPTMKYFNAIGLQASAVGNHEFDKGYARIVSTVRANENFPLLGANVMKKGTQTPALPEYSIQVINGVRVGVVGAITQNTPNIVVPDGVKDVTFGDPVAAVNRVAGKLKSQGLADVVIAEYHSGGQLSSPATLAENEATDTEFSDLVNNTSPAVDVLFTAHSHQAYTYAGPLPDGGTRPVIQSSSFGRMLGEVRLGLDPKTKKVVTYSEQNLPTKGVDLASCQGNATVDQAKTIVDDAKAKAATTGNVVIGTQTADLLGGDGESVLANMDAQAWLDEMNEPGRPGADIGIMNPGGVRSDLPYKSSGSGKDGEITYGEAFAVNPFNNTMQIETITGTQLKTMLEQQWATRSGDQIIPLLGLSKNVHYTYDASKPFGQRITSVSVNGKPVTAGATYRVTSGSFIIGGGDGYTVLKEGTKKVDTGLNDGDTFVDWVKKHSPITPDASHRGVAGAGDTSSTPGSTPTGTTPTGSPTPSGTPSGTPTSSPTPGTPTPTGTTTGNPTGSTGHTVPSGSPTVTPTTPAPAHSSTQPGTPGRPATGPKVETDNVSTSGLGTDVAVAALAALAGVGAFISRRRRA